jgi:uncharacterized protein DUF6526
MDTKQQNFANHARWDPPFHFFILPVLLISVIAVAVHFLRHLDFQHPWLIVHNAWLLIVAIALMLAVLKSRIYALRVQDRVIRLEERLRLAAVLQEPLRSRIDEIQETQLFGLRFAPDAELPALVKRALDEKLSRTDIKKAIVNWRPDNHRI